MTAHAIHILLVEDDPIDVESVQRCLEHTAVEHVLKISRSGADALRELQDPELPQTALPDIILLDLNTPRLNGFEFLAAVKDDSRLDSIPVIVVTTSAAERDVCQSYRSGAAGYITKPLSHKQFAAQIRAILDYWTICTLPRRR